MSSRPRDLIQDMRRVPPDWRRSLRVSTAKRLRRLAAWLTRAANWIEPGLIEIER